MFSVRALAFMNLEFDSLYFKKLYIKDKSASMAKTKNKTMSPQGAIHVMNRVFLFRLRRTKRFFSHMCLIRRNKQIKQFLCIVLSYLFALIITRPLQEWLVDEAELTRAVTAIGLRAPVRVRVGNGKPTRAGTYIDDGDDQYHLISVSHYLTAHQASLVFLHELVHAGQHECDSEQSRRGTANLDIGCFYGRSEDDCEVEARMVSQKLFSSIRIAQPKHA